jgi:adenylylsulfate kinase
MKILVMGLPGSGKTWLSERLQKHLECAWYNADKVREMANDWNFSPEGRVRQANRMRNIADYEKSHGRKVICDFVCPTQQTRNQFDADITIWMDTIEKGRFEDTNKMFENPINEMGTLLVDHHVTHLMSDAEIEEFAKNV